eukprot:2824910-Rhodomonas_salina.2
MAPSASRRAQKRIGELREVASLIALRIRRPAHSPDTVSSSQELGGGSIFVILDADHGKDNVTLELQVRPSPAFLARPPPPHRRARFPARDSSVLRKRSLLSSPPSLRDLSRSSSIQHVLMRVLEQMVAPVMKEGDYLIVEDSNLDGHDNAVYP